MDGDWVARAGEFLAQDQDIAFGLKTSTGEFVVESFTAHEAVNELFEVQLNLFSPWPDIDLHALMDTQATLEILSKYDQPRYLTGIITDCARGDSGIRRTAYQITLRPPLARLAHVSDGRIWQHVSVVDAAKQLLGEHNIHAVEWQLNETYPSREYLTQVPGERTLDFIKRILNEVGIFWFFEHQADQCRLIFTDAPLATSVLPNVPTLTYNNTPGGQSRGSWIDRFSQFERLRSSDMEYGEYWFKNPSAGFNQTSHGQENNGAKQSYKRYEAPGRYKDASQVGKPMVKARIEAERVDATTGEGTTNNIHLCPGWHFSITDHPDPKVNASHFLLNVTHRGTQAAALEEDAPTDEATTYKASFTTMPAHLPYRPPAPKKPTIDGPQVGIVVGPEGEEIYTDEFGRVRVWLTWDRHAERRKGDGQREEHATCWMRVAQNWAGVGFGHIAIPRINQEVLVSYIDSDCDQPIITSRTYNAINPVPYKLPEHKTRMTIKSKTHKGTGFNELRFEDEKDNEEIRIHAERDMNTIVKNDRSAVIVGHSVDSVRGVRLTETLGNNITTSVGGITIMSGPSALATSAFRGFGNFSNKVSASAKGLGVALLSRFRPGDINIVGDLNVVQTAGVDIITHAGQNSVYSSGVDTTIDVGRNLQVNISKSRRAHIKKNDSVTIEGTKVDRVEKVMDLSVGQKLVIRSGESRITLDQDGNILIKGNNIKMEASENLVLKGKKVSIN